MKNENFINIRGWMINDLGLKGNELILYAIIYGFSQDGVSKYKGSITYIQKALSVSRNTAIGLIKKLTDKGLIIKENNITGSLYSVNFNTEGSAKTAQCKKYTSAKTELVGSAKTELVGSAKIAPNNKYNINNNIKNKNNINIIENREDFQEFLDDNIGDDGKEMKEDKRDFDIDLIIETLKENNGGVIDGSRKEIRWYGRLLKLKMNKITGFNGDYKLRILNLYNRSNSFNKIYFRSPKTLYYNLASIVCGIKIELEKPKIRTGC